MKYQLDLINGESVEIDADQSIQDLRDAIDNNLWMYESSPEGNSIRCSAVIRIRVVAEPASERRQKLLRMLYQRPRI